MLAKLKQFGPLINLIPNTAIQFLDFGFNLNEARVSRAFLTETGADGRAVLTTLYPDDASGQFVTQDGRAVKPEQAYSLNAAKAATLFDGAWLPLPFLRVREPRPDGYHLFDKGPVNWARARLVELPAPDAEGHTHRLTLAFDTQLLPTREGRPYLAPSPLDMQSGEEQPYGTFAPQGLVARIIARTRRASGSYLGRKFAFALRRLGLKALKDRPVDIEARHVARAMLAPAATPLPVPMVATAVSENTVPSAGTTTLGRPAPATSASIAATSPGKYIRNRPPVESRT